jgi:hypothetical protein
MYWRVSTRPRLLCRRQGQHRAPTLEGHHAGARAERAALDVFDDELMRKVDASGLSASDKVLFRARVAAARSWR